MGGPLGPVAPPDMALHTTARRLEERVGREGERKTKRNEKGEKKNMRQSDKQVSPGKGDGKHT